MALVTLREILAAAKEGNYAVPAFDTLDHISAQAVIETAEAAERPVILMVPEVALPMINVDSFFGDLVRIAKNAKIPVALELDHGKSYDVLVKAIRNGFTGVMFDGSELPFEENVAMTKKVVEVAHAAGVSVEAEIGHVAGGEGNMEEGSEVDESMYTKPEDAKKFAEETGVDALAIAFGTVHGVYKGTPKLDLERLAVIKDMVSIPLVMHGGSGVSDEEFQKAVKAGINKVNFFTEISMAAVSSAVAYGQKKECKLHFIELLLAAKKTVAERVNHYIELLK